MKKIVVFLLAAITTGCLVYFIGLQFRKDKPATPPDNVKNRAAP